MYNTTGQDAYYTGAMASTKQKNALTSEEIKLLAGNNPQFSLKLGQTEYLRAVCTHRTEDGTHDTLVMDQVTGKFRCTVCGYVFDIIDPSTSKEEIRESISLVQDIMQTAKILYIDMPVNVAREYMQIIAMLDKLPEFFEIAANNYLKHETSLAGWNYNNKNAGAAQLFNILNNGMSGGAYPQAGMVNNAAVGFAPDGRPLVMAPDGSLVPVGMAADMRPGMAPVFNGGQPMGAGAYGAATRDYSYNPALAATAAPATDPMMTVCYNMADQGYTPEQIVSAIGKDLATVNSWLAAKPKAAAVPAESGATTTVSFQS